MLNRHLEKAATTAKISLKPDEKATVGKEIEEFILWFDCLRRFE